MYMYMYMYVHVFMQGMCTVHTAIHVALHHCTYNIQSLVIPISSGVKVLLVLQNASMIASLSINLTSLQLYY